MRFSPRFFLTFGLCFFLAACAALRNETTGIELPDTEQRAYRYLVLDNGLKVLLVSDPGADKAGAPPWQVASSSHSYPATHLLPLSFFNLARFVIIFGVSGGSLLIVSSLSTFVQC